jgi:integrase
MLNDQTIKGLIAKARREGHEAIGSDTGGVAGLQVRCSPKGKASFALYYRPDGAKNRTRLPLGVYGPRFTLALARAAAATARTKIIAGQDPLAERLAAKAAQRQQEAERASRLTTATMFETFVASHYRGSEAGTRTRVHMRRDFLALLGNKNIGDLTRRDIQRVIDHVVARGKLVQARTVFGCVRTYLGWALKRGYVTTRFWADVDLPGAPSARTRVLTAADIRWLWARTAEWIAGSRALSNLGRQSRLALLLGRRSEEIGGATVDEFTEHEWTLPATRTKNGVAHTLPMPPLASELVADSIAAAEGDHLFVGDYNAVVSPDATAHLLRRLIEGWNADHGEADRIKPFRMHDLRRTCATGLEFIGTPETVIAAVLNHISHKTQSVTRRHYAHSDLTLAVLEALSRWQAVIEDVLAGGDPFSVKAQDREAVIARALARGADGKPRLSIVGLHR